MALIFDRHPKFLCQVSLKTCFIFFVWNNRQQSLVLIPNDMHHTVGLPRNERLVVPKLGPHGQNLRSGSNISVPCNRCGSPPCYVMLQFEYVFFVDVSELY